MRRSVLYVNLAVLLFGLAGLFAKWVRIPALGITFGRVFFSSITLLIYLLARRRPLRLQARRDLGLFILAGAVLALHWWTFLESIQLSSVAVGTIAYASFPLFVTFLEPLVFRRRLRAEHVLTALAILAGLIVATPGLSLANRQVRGLLVGLVSALSYAVLTLMNKGFSRDYESVCISFYEQSVAALALTPAVLVSGIRPSAADIGLLLLLGVFMTALAHTLFISSLKKIPAQLAGICSSMETVYGILFAFLFLHELPTVRQCLGAAIIVGAVAFSQVRQKDGEAAS